MVYNIFMFNLNRDKLDLILRAKKMNISDLAKGAGISRKSIYDMCEGRSILSTPFTKLLSFLKIGMEEITESSSKIETLINEAPDRVKKTLLRLQQYAKARNANLYLFGSRVRGRKLIRSDWDLAVYFQKGKPKGFAEFKEKMQEAVFPYKIDIVVLDDAPEWFLKSISVEAINIEGAMSVEDIINERRAA